MTDWDPDRYQRWYKTPLGRMSILTKWLSSLGSRISNRASAFSTSDAVTASTRASTKAPSLNPMDPLSKYYDAGDFPEVEEVAAVAESNR